jgi:hypothetical protein
MKIIAYRTLNGFEVQESDREKIQKMKLGKMVQIDVTSPRNIKFHRMFFGMLQEAFKNQDQYTPFERFVDVIKLGIHHVDVIIMPNGFTTYKPKSISFAKMDNEAFSEFFDKAGHYIEDTFNIPWEDLKLEAEKM